MTTRDQMLASIKANQPAMRPIPAQFTFTSVYPDLTQQFIDILTFVGGAALIVPDFAAIRASLQTQFPNMTSVATTCDELADLADVTMNVSDPHELSGLNLAIIEGPLAVAENAAIWVDERQLPQRVAPMITQYLVIIIRQSTIVPNMHDAYKLLKVDETGFGTFICGPSKTADIEQSLVIGAHGARSLMVYILP
ncbi:LutC/YkgG family protein [Spirosoma fluviale]|uniref:L-lactate dehydrogenase complex protein LldG n=1 Tax=Spirosoma fluviale TaxID=1597977 RepID=A0A286GCQ6_9BACT|nr:LUD domain-containing protein [Spirosoma fluviale]SOD93026.1 L-lactate dehydrogenase complex protein LldG [Spirosoma fluviale]